MKGIVFTEFIEFVEQRYSLDIADEMIEACELQSGGAYTSVGTYDCGEMLTLVTALGELTGTPVPDLVRSFGHHLFSRLAAAHPEFLAGIDDSFSFLKLIENHIHREVRKLYPDAELPRFEWEAAEADVLVLTYRSRRPLADLAQGLILGCVDHFAERVDLKREDLADSPEMVARFTLRLQGEQ
jgi:hypothetical protein